MGHQARLYKETPQSVAAGRTTAEIERLAGLAEQLKAGQLKDAGHLASMADRNWWTRFLDAGAGWVREHVPVVHWIGAWIFAAVLFVYARLLAFTVRVVAAGDRQWPDLPAPSVLVLWHGSAPALLAAIARKRPAAPLAIMIAGDPRGDALAMLCRMMRMRVVRGHSGSRGWEALMEMAEELERPVCAILTPDGGGPAHYAKPGAVALASASGVPLFALGVECKPALAEPHKWDTARNPLPWSRVGIIVSEPVAVAEIRDIATFERFRRALQHELDSMAVRARQALESR